MQKVSLDQIDFDVKYYPRASGVADWMTVNVYREALLSPGYEFPPITVVRSPVKRKNFRYVLLDGLHRYKAYVDVDRTKIPATVERLPESRWFCRAVELNAKHGRQFNVQDKAWIGERLQRQGYKVDDVAKVLCMPSGTVEKIVGNRITRIKGHVTGPGHRQINGNTVVVAKKVNEVFTNTKKASQSAIECEHFAGRHVHQIMDGMITILRLGLNYKDASLAAKADIIYELLDKSRTKS